MARRELTEHKSADRLAFDHYMRTGQRLDVAEFQIWLERKFNPNHDPANGRFTSGPGGSHGDHEIVVYGRKPGKSASADKKWKPKSAKVKVPDKISSKIDAVANDYHAETGKTLTVTDGVRTPRDQAERMYYKYSHGDFSTYKGPQGAQIAAIYRKGVADGKSPSQILDDMTATIDRNLQDGNAISKHLYGRGAISDRTI